MILLDNTVLSNFALVGQLHLLRLFCHGRALTTDIVYAEFEEGVALKHFSAADTSWITSHPDERN